jgi:hypothetical protein
MNNALANQVNEQTESYTLPKMTTPYTPTAYQDTEQTQKIKQHIKSSGPETQLNPGCIHLGSTYTTLFTKINKSTQMMSQAKITGQSQRRSHGTKIKTVQTLRNNAHQSLRYKRLPVQPYGHGLNFSYTPYTPSRSDPGDCNTPNTLQSLHLCR